MYTFDHRGTGKSNFLDCSAHAEGSEIGGEISLEELPSCISEVDTAIDGSWQAFQTLSVTKDVLELIFDLNDDDDVYLLGGGYGSYVAERVRRWRPTNVKGYILESAVAEGDHSILTAFRDADVVGTNHLISPLSRSFAFFGVCEVSNLITLPFLYRDRPNASKLLRR